jgi:glycosyltransferase involved in cell wall biosynthesis
MDDETAGQARRIHVLQVTESMGIGGLERVIATICREVDPREFKVSILALRELGTFGAELRAEGFDVTVLSRTQGAVDYTAALKVARFLRMHPVDVVHTHNTHAFLDGTVGALLARVKTIVHTDHAREFPDKWRYMAAERLLSRFAFRVVGVSDATTRNLVRYIRIPEHRLATIPNGVSAPMAITAPARRAVRTSLGIHEEDRAIGLCARLTGQKGVPHLIAAMPEVLRRVPRARLLLAGGGDMEDELKRQVLDLGLRRAVTFLGRRDDVPLLLQAFDVLALPSLWEGLPMVVLEAMAAGCPVVASAVGGLPDVIQDRVSGRLVPAADPAALAARWRMCFPVTRSAAPSRSRPEPALTRTTVHASWCSPTRSCTAGNTPDPRPPRPATAADCCLHTTG